MTVTPPGGLFGAFAPFDERTADELFGRTDEVALLDRLLSGDARLVVFTGTSGVGKTSVLRAGLGPALARRGVATLVLGSYHDLERELVRETSRLGIAPPVPGQDPGDYLGGVARDAKGGLVLVFDHLEEALAPDGMPVGVRPGRAGGAGDRRGRRHAADRPVRRRALVRAAGAAADGAAEQDRGARVDGAAAAVRGQGGRDPRAQRRPVGHRLREGPGQRRRRRPVPERPLPRHRHPDRRARHRRPASRFAAAVPAQRRRRGVADHLDRSCGRRLRWGGRPPRAGGRRAGARRGRRSGRARPQRAGSGGGRAERPAGPRPAGGHAEGPARGLRAGPPGAARAGPAGDAGRPGARGAGPADLGAASRGRRAPAGRRAGRGRAQPARRADAGRPHHREAQPGGRRHARRAGRGAADA